MKYIKNYKSSLILLGSVIIGAIVGLIFKESASIVSPLGDLFLNLLLVAIIPLIFFTIASSIAKMKEPKRLGKILVSIIIVFTATTLISVLFGLASTKAVQLVKPENSEIIKENLKEIENLTKLRDTLLPMLMNGEIKIK